MRPWDGPGMDDDMAVLRAAAVHLDDPTKRGAPQLAALAEASGLPEDETADAVRRLTAAGLLTPDARFAGGPGVVGVAGITRAGRARLSS